MSFIRKPACVPLDLMRDHLRRALGTEARSLSAIDYDHVGASSSRESLPPDLFRVSRVKGAVLLLNPADRAWLSYMYAYVPPEKPQGGGSDVALLGAVNFKPLSAKGGLEGGLWEEYRIRAGLLRKDVAFRGRQLLRLALAEYEYLMRVGQRRSSNQDFALGLGLGERSFDHKWQARLAIALDVIEERDCRVIEDVYDNMSGPVSSR